MFMQLLNQLFGLRVPLVLTKTFVTISNRSVGSRSLLVGEQSNALRILLRNDRKSRHRRIKKQRRYERLAATSHKNSLSKRIVKPRFFGLYSYCESRSSLLLTLFST
uniref:Uncharacterized protein n=1 Tax=Panagrolaimus sp. JU765 TaxID=591449 RepID=A0AC34R9H1_9BILA